MLETEGKSCKTSFVRFSYPEKNDILFLSMSHFGTKEYFQSVQEIIDGHRGPILYEFNPRTEPEEGNNEITAKIFELACQEDILVLPEGRTYGPNYSSEEVIESVPSFLKSMRRIDAEWGKFKKLYDALLARQEASKVALSFLSIHQFRKDVSTVPWWEKDGLIAGGKREKDFFRYLERLAEREFSIEEKNAIVALLSFGTLPDETLYEFYIVFRERKLLELIEQVQEQASPLVIYGAGHYYCVARELHNLGYSSSIVRKLEAFPVREVKMDEFLEALHNLMDLGIHNLRINCKAE